LTIVAATNSEAIAQRVGALAKARSADEKDVAARHAGHTRAAPLRTVGGWREGGGLGAAPTLAPGSFIGSVFFG
jgi:hypothetical protein